MTVANDLICVRAENAVPDTGGSGLNCPALSCQLLQSELTCLVGPQRTQLRSYLHMLAGISWPEQGMVEVLGQQPKHLDQQAWQEFRSQIGYLSGASPLISSQHALMNVMLPLLYHQNLSFRQTADKARALLEHLGCHFQATLYPAQLNSFQRAQLALARALILEPLLLIMDVPFNELGAKERHKMAKLLAECKSKRSVCMIGGLQYPRFLQQYADQIIFISKHKVLKFNGWQEFVENTDTEVQTLLSAYRDLN